jgi:hypothetical protein
MVETATPEGARGAAFQRDSRSSRWYPGFDLRKQTNCLFCAEYGPFPKPTGALFPAAATETAPAPSAFRSQLCFTLHLLTPLRTMATSTAMPLPPAVLNSHSRGDGPEPCSALSGELPRARDAWELPRGPYYKGEHGEEARSPKHRRVFFV